MRCCKAQSVEPLECTGHCHHRGRPGPKDYAGGLSHRSCTHHHPPAKVVWSKLYGQGSLGGLKWPLVASRQSITWIAIQATNPTKGRHSCKTPTTYSSATGARMRHAIPTDVTCPEGHSSYHYSAFNTIQSFIVHGAALGRIGLGDTR